MIYDIYEKIVTHNDLWNLMGKLNLEYQLNHDGCMDFTNKLSLGNGDSNGLNPNLLRIGVSNLKRYSDEPIKELLFMRGLVTIYHEWRHAD